MKQSFPNAVRRRKQEILERLEYLPESSERPVFAPGTLDYELSEKTKATPFGGVALLLQLMRRLGLPDLLNGLKLLKIHLPYHESDHTQNLILNFACGGDCLEDIERLRNDPAYLDALGTRRIPDPTTAGDFLRRFAYDDCLQLMDILNVANARAWCAAGPFTDNAVLDIDSMIKPTYAECKEGMDMSYKGSWAFHPLVVTEAQTTTHIAVINRSGNVASQNDATRWIDYAIGKVRDYFPGVLLRGDSAFSLTKNFDRWGREGIGFCFGYDCTPNLVALAEKLPKNAWKRVLSKRPAPVREPKRRYKQERVVARGYRDMKTVREDVADFVYKPGKCEQTYRMVVLRKELKVTRGQLRFTNTVRYFFYITNIEEPSPTDILEFIRGRCNHENHLQQLSGGVHALAMPAAEFRANWAYMLIGAMAWNLKSWLGLLFPDAVRGRELRRLEYKRFVRSIVAVPCQILKTGRRTVYRLLATNEWTEDCYLAFCSFKCRHRFC